MENSRKSKGEDVGNVADWIGIPILFFHVLFLCVWMFFLHAYMDCRCTLQSRRSEEEFGCSAAGVTDTFELPLGFREFTLGPLDE